MRFKGLDFLRFYFAVSVIISHIHYTQVFLGLPVTDPLPVERFLLDGWDSVTAFFTLSGFLIVYLLLSERVKTGQIDVKRFYVRRAFRILPLYYLTLLFGMVFSALGGLAFFLMLFLVPNLTVNMPTGMLGAMWSIGTEENFYLTIPQIISRVRQPVKVFVLVIVVKLLLVAGAYGVLFRGADASVVFPIIRVLTYSRFEAMALGGIGAWLFLRQSPYLQLIHHWLTQIIAWAFFLVVVFTQREHHLPTDFLIDFAFACVCLVMILNVATNPRPLVSLHWKGVERLGELSYSMYLVHLPVLFLLAPLGLQVEVLALAACALTITIAYALHRWFELPMLALRDRLTAVQENKVQPVGEAVSL